MLASALLFWRVGVRSVCCAAFCMCSSFAHAQPSEPTELPRELATVDSTDTVVRPASNWKAGVAKAIITPTTPVWLAGYGTKRVPDGRLHDLWMKVLALEDDQGRRVVLVTSDFQGVPKVMSDPVFAQVLERYGLNREQIMITFSHNHCGPRLGDDLIDYYPVEREQEALVAEYTNNMVALMVDTIGRALDDLAPAELEQCADTATFAVNRRNNVEAEVPQKLAEGLPLRGPVDHTVPVLVVRAAQAAASCDQLDSATNLPDQEIKAILFGYACHPTTLSFSKWCGDYPGFAQLEIEAAHPHAMAMFVNTCGGDQNPLPRRTVELCQNYGHQLADAVERALNKPPQVVGSQLTYAFQYVDLLYLEVIDRVQLSALVQDGHAVRARWAARMLGKLDAGEEFAKSYPYPVHAWQLGSEMLVIGMGAETVVDYALRFKGEHGAGTWVCGYADDMISYIPTRRVWEEGGYEGGANLFEYGRPALRWAGDIEQRIAACVDQLVRQVRTNNR